MGLCGEDPVTIDVNSIASKTARIQSEKKLLLNGKKEIGVNVEFLVNETLSFHPNGLSFLADCGGSIQISETFFSIGGGFVVKENEDKNKTVVVDLPFPINTSEDLLHWCMKTGLSIHEVVMENENAWRKEARNKTRCACDLAGDGRNVCIVAAIVKESYRADCMYDGEPLILIKN
jgi:L-serine dehydratase